MSRRRYFEEQRSGNGAYLSLMLKSIPIMIIVLRYLI
mgnify:CR=1 FL=1